MLESCWDSLVHLAKAVRAFSEPIGWCGFRFGDAQDISLNAPLEEKPGSRTVTVILDEKIRADAVPADGCLLRLKDAIHVVTVRGGGLPRNIRRLIQVYLPYCFASVPARRRGRAFAVSHLAQSLDGRIATSSGDSKLLGSPGNFLHAHRMRALCDGVLIGSQTLKRDRPQLTVRLVSGRNPSRVVLGSTAEGIESLTRSSADPVLLIGAETGEAPDGVRRLAVGRDNGFMPTASILKALFEEGIYSVFIEGGGLTASRFLEENNIDILQLHISPIIVGSGVSSFSLPAVSDIASSLHLKSHLFFPVDDAVMLVAALGRPGEAGTRP